jgi:hypothetical protein
MSFTFKQSPNFTKGTRPKVGYIIHGTLGKYEGAVEWLCTPPEKRPVISYSSAHYVVAKDGRCTQLVKDADVSWHAGNISNPTSRARELLTKENGVFLNPNETFIGIELEWFEGQQITEQQYARIVEIIKAGGIKNPILLTHREVTDYKKDFLTSTGGVDITIVQEIQKRLYPTPVVDTVSPLLAQLNARVAAKDYKGAKDSCSYLFTELSKLSK